LSTKIRERTSIIAIFAISASLILACLGITSSVVLSRNRAEAFLAGATALQLRSATLQQVQRLSVTYGGHIEPTTCDPQGCAYTFRFDNGWLHRLRLAPLTLLTCTLGLAGNTLVYRRVFLTTTGKGLDSGAFVQEWVSYPEGLQVFKKSFDVRPQFLGESAEIKWRVHVNLTADATTEQHRIAYGLNLRCLSRIGGCRDAQQLLPSIVWQNFHARGNGERRGSARFTLCHHQGGALFPDNLAFKAS
jgi:hypothetical protein